MLQILSTSNETSTGAELVQNGNFAELNPELVTNGDFSAGGADWTLGNGWSIGTNKAIHSTDIGGAARLTQSGFSNTANYKVTITITNKGTNSYRFFDGSGSAVSLLEGTNTYYVTGLLVGILIIDPQSSDGSDVEFTDFSVRAVQEDWILGTGWSIGADKAISTVTGSSSYLTQAGIVESGSTYVVGFEVVDYTGGNVKSTVSGDEGAVRTSIGTYTDTLLATGSSLSIKSQSGSFDGSVSSITARLKNTGAVTLTLTNQLTEKVTTVELTPILSNGRYTEFSYQPTDLIEGMYLIKFTGDSTTYAETLAYITTGTPPLGESSYKAYTTGDDNPDHVYIP